MLELEEHRAAVDVLERVDLELERGRYPEVAGAALECPQQVGVLVGVGHDGPAIRGHDLGTDEVVTGQSVAASEIADAAAERQAGHSRGRDDAARGGQAVLVGRGVEVAPGGSTLHPRGALCGVHADAPHPGQVGDDSIVDGSEARHAMAAAADGQGQLVLSRVVDRSRDITSILGTDDRRRPTVDHGVVDGSCVVVAIIGRGDDRAADAFTQLLDGGLGHGWDLDAPPGGRVTIHSRHTHHAFLTRMPTAHGRPAGAGRASAMARSASMSITATPPPRRG